MSKLTKRCFELIARVLILYIFESKVSPSDFKQVQKMAEGEWGYFEEVLVKTDGK